MSKKPPKVRMAKPTGRPIQLRYTDPETKKEVRITTETYDPEVAAEQMKALEAKLLLGIDAKPKRRKGGPSMDWQEFRERYRELKLTAIRERSADCAENRLDIAERIMKPRTLADLATTESLHNLQAKLLAGAEGKGKRSRHTVKNYMATILASLNWACTMGWLPSVPRVEKVKCSKLRHAKGRGITDKEFKAVLDAVVGVVGVDAAPSWKYLLNGLRESGLRLDELLHVHWSDGRYIVPVWNYGELPVLSIPAPMQKNDTEESIPLLPGFESLLLETAAVERFGWCFNPVSLNIQHGRRVQFQRPNADWVSKVICRIGKASGVVVLADNGKGKPKHVSAHDLRRTCTVRLIAAGVPERDASVVLRHASVETTRRYYAPEDVQSSASVIRECLNVPRYNESVEST